MNISVRVVDRRTRQCAFTLVELLSVIAIISVLSGLTLASISYARRFADKNVTKQEIQMLVAGIERYSNENGDYPPGSLSALKVKVNTINAGRNACRSR